MSCELTEAREDQLDCTPPQPTAPSIMYDIKINKLDAGYIVNVGCKNFAIGTKEELIIKLTSYINDPKRVEALHNKGELF